MILSALRNSRRYAPPMLESSPAITTMAAMMTMMMSACSVPFLTRSVRPAPRFCAVKLVIAAPRALSGVIMRVLTLFAAPKPFCAALETIAPSSMSNFTTQPCITMIPTESTENCRPSGMPCTMWRRRSQRVIRQSSRCRRSSGYFANA